MVRRRLRRHSCLQHSTGVPWTQLFLRLSSIAGVDSSVPAEEIGQLPCLKASGPLIIYFIYCLISVTWSPFPGPAFKRWIKAVGDLVMVLVMVTDAQPTAALRRLYSRLGFILFPVSILLIRYTDLGRGYEPDGTPMNTGVTTNKNTLGLIVYLVSLGALWSFRGLLKDKKAPNRTRRLVAQGTLLTFGIVLLQMAHSATSIACFILGAGSCLRRVYELSETGPAECMRSAWESFL